MIRLIIIAFALTITGCKTKQQLNFEDVECSSFNSSVNSNLRRVFKPCRQYIYRAKYWDKEFNKISDERIWMMATGQGWEYQPELQDELVIQYSYDEAAIDKIWSYNINNELSDRSWIKKEVTGVIEDASGTWMHPFRSNQYLFTEVACFPSVKFPLEIGKTWTSNLNIYDGWGDWANSILNNTYEILDFESIDIPFKKLDAWHIIGTTHAEFGVSKHSFWYHEEYGFVKMVIKNYKGQLLTFELEEVREE